MKKSRLIQLVLVGSVAVACDSQDKGWEETADKKVYMRSDTTAHYHRTHHGFGTGLLMWYAFRPMGLFSNGVYTKGGYYSGGIPKSANVGTNTSKSGVVRGGFGTGSSAISAAT